jgi:hypothetical protein
MYNNVIFQVKKNKTLTAVLSREAHSLLNAIPLKVIEIKKVKPKKRQP